MLGHPMYGSLDALRPTFYNNYLVNRIGHMIGVYKVEIQHVLAKSHKPTLYKVAWPRKNIKVDVGF
jgi:hypothetical protein